MTSNTNIESIVLSAIQNSQNGSRLVQLQQELDKIQELGKLSPDMLVKQEADIVEKFKTFGYGEMPLLQQYESTIGERKGLYFNDELSAYNLKAGYSDLTNMLKILIDSERAKVAETVQEELQQYLDNKADSSSLVSSIINFDYLNEKLTNDDSAKLIDIYVQQEVKRQVDLSQEYNNENAVGLGR